MLLIQPYTSDGEANSIVSLEKCECVIVNGLASYITEEKLIRSMSHFQSFRKSMQFNFLESRTVPVCHFQLLRLAGLVGHVKAQWKVVGMTRSVNRKVMYNKLHHSYM